MRLLQLGGTFLLLGLMTPSVQAEWVLDGTLPEPVGYHGVAVLDGGILVFGGYNGTVQVSDAYLYSPGGGWDDSSFADMPEARHYMGFVTHQEKVYSAAGYLEGAGVWGRTVDVWSYDPLTNAWATECSLSYERDSNAAVSLGDYLYSIGGHHEDTGHGFSLSLVERHNPDLGIPCPWEQVAPLNQDDRPGPGGNALGRAELGAAVVDGKIYAIGGASYEGGVHSVLRSGWVEVYDPNTDTWDDSLPPMPTPRKAFATVVLGSRIYTIGGMGNGEEGQEVWTDVVEYYDGSAGQWHANTPFPIDIAGARAVTIDDAIYVLGGQSPAGYLDTVYLFRGPTTLSLDVKPGSCPNPLNRSSHGVLPVALLGAEDFDVTQIDVSSVRLVRADGAGTEVAPNEGPPGPHSVFEDVGTPFAGEEWCDCHGYGGDGIIDLSMKFRTDDVVEALQLNDLSNGDWVELAITGSLLDGSEFTSAGDCILIVPPGVSNLHVESNVSGSFVDVGPADLNADAGGFADFVRSHDPGTVIALTAPTSSDGRSFRAWEIDGVLQAVGQNDIQVTIVQDVTARAIYRPRQIKSPGIGEHGGWPSPLQR